MRALRSCNGMIKTGLVSTILLAGMSCVAIIALPAVHIRPDFPITEVLSLAFWGVQYHCQSRSSI